MKNRLTRYAAGVLLAGALTAGVAAPAFAAQETSEPTGSAQTRPGTVDEAKELCLAGIARRQAKLVELEGVIGASPVLTDGHEATLAAIIDGTQAGLGDLEVQISAATTSEELRDLCPKIATDHRVYLLVVPQVHLTIGADHADTVVVRGNDAIERLDAAIADAAAAGADVAQAQAHRDAAAALIAEVDAATDGLADAVLAVTPATYNSGEGKVVVDDARAALRGAHADLEEARREIVAAVQALRSALP